MKRVSEGEEPPVVIPPVAPEIQVELPVRRVTIEVRDVAVVVRVLPRKVQDIIFTTIP